MRGFALGTAVVALAWSMAAQGVEVGGVALGDKANVGGQELVLNGAGVRTRAIFKVYVASLYVPAKATTPAGVLAKGPRRIQMNLLRTLSADQLVDALVDGLKDNNTEAEIAAVKAQQDQMVATMKGFGEVKEKFRPVFKALDHHALHEHLPDLPDCDAASVSSWVLAQTRAVLPAVDRVDLFDSNGAGAIACADDALPLSGL